MLQNLIALLLASSLSFGSGAVVASQPQPTFDDSALISVTPIPHQLPDAGLPGQMSAKSIIAMDVTSGTTLYEKNADIALPIASLTKLMTAYIILEETDPNAVVTVSANAASTEGSRMGLTTGEQITVKNLLFGMLMNSGNDAAMALAEFDAGSHSAFVTKMNQKAKELGLDQTIFANSTGLDYGDNHSTARNLGMLSLYLLKNQAVREIVKNSSFDVTSEDGATHHLVNTNILLGTQGIKGLKTGKTPAAGQCFISLADTPTGHEVLTVVLGSENRFADTKVLLDWVYNSYVW
ncbi:D-alanyl-D-alanine carboxypeptidase [Patescibacteria group bacterium]|nr:D-alanyl-D-alanine carboxypeptidase [Patescibacteria group bacterium]